MDSAPLLFDVQERNGSACMRSGPPERGPCYLHSPLVSLRTFLAVSPDLNFDKVAHLLYEATHSTQKGWCLHLLFCVTAKPVWHIGKTWSNDNSTLLMAPTIETWPRLGKITTCFLLYMAYFFQRCDYWWKLVNLLGAIWQSKNRSPFGSPRIWHWRPQSDLNFQRSREGSSVKHNPLCCAGLLIAFYLYFTWTGESKTGPRKNQIVV